MQQTFQEVVSQCRAALPLPELMRKLGLGDKVKPKALSPFREEKDGSFGVFERDGRWYWKDFAMDESGDEVDFLVLLKGLDKAGALNTYKELAGIIDAQAKKEAPPAKKYDWASATAALSEDSISEICKWRGLPASFLTACRDKGLIGLVEGAVSFPVMDAHGTSVVGAHVRNKGMDSGWRFTEGAKNQFPFVMGNARTAETIYCGESQWDMLALASSLGWRPDDADACREVAFVATRGASSGKLVGTLAPKKGARVILIPQNDPDKGDGKPTPAQIWMSRAQEALKDIKVSPYIADIPPDFKDMNDWVKAGASPLTIEKAIAAAKQIRRKSGLPAPDDGTRFVEDDIPLPVELVQGVLHVGTKLVLGGPSKAYKTWALLHLAVAVATGGDWWGFPCRQGKVIYLNFEIPRPFMRKRLEAICEAKGIKLQPGQLEIWNLRGHAGSFETLLEEIVEQLKDGGYVLCVVDPVYKVMGERDENSASDMNNLMNTFEQLCQQTGVAVAFGSHFAKGNASGKESIDRISGSGVTARDPDSIITLTRHSAGDAYFTADFTLRNMPRVEPFVLMRDHPIMIRCEELDPNDLKQPERAQKEKPSKAARSDDGKAEREKAKQQRRWEPLLAALTAPMLASEWYEAVKVQGISRTTFYRYKDDMRDAELVWLNPTDNKYERT